VLCDKEVFHRDEAKLPSMGISNWASLLVHQRDDLPGPRAGKLVEEDENMPTM
jgi:hypothetical protein